MFIRISTIFILAFAIGIFVSSAYAEIKSDTIVGIWLLDEGKGDTVKDASGNGHDGKFVGKIGWTDGKFEKALEFTGVGGNRVEIPHDNSLTLAEWTITAWTKQKPTGAWAVVLVKDPANGIQNYALDMNEQGLVFSEVTAGGNWSDCGSTTKVTDEKWHFLAASYDGKNLHVHVDGKHEKEQPFAKADSNTAPVTIGDRLDGSQPISGIIDDVGLFSVALSEKDINDIMTKGLGTATSVAAVDSGGKLASTWGMIKNR
ncbi:LamG domain-containing protein [Candidatus Poribacteria bacterium]|nr:LamG domain-containing protein [Candidatus Poribacteria bacterium]